MTHYSELKIDNYFHIDRLGSKDINKVVGVGYGAYDTSGVNKWNITLESVTDKLQTEVLISDSEYLENYGIYPIELTEELILKYGFEKCESDVAVFYSKLSKNISGENYHRIINKDPMSYTDYAYGMTFRYLHQFQQYLFLTNQEAYKITEIII